jgi:hypothetical protein
MDTLLMQMETRVGVLRLSPREGKIMRQLLENKMAIITGASKGIGRH